MSREHRGFASMDCERQREIARKGGRIAHQRGTAHEWTRDEAREAGRKGGSILLRSGEDPTASRVEAIAAALDDIATTLDEIDDRRVTNSREILTMRKAIEEAIDAIDGIEERISK